jgi:Porphyromonas-type peptidyl-arginine deiminase
VKRLGALAGVTAGLVATLLVLSALGARQAAPRPAPTRLVAEDASAPLARIAIHYAPAADRVALGVWTQLFAQLPTEVRVDVEVAEAAHFQRFLGAMRAAQVPQVERRFHPVIVGASITTWSRDRYASLVDEQGEGTILAPPFLGAAFAGRTGDFRSAFAMSQAMFGHDPRIAKYAFEGGDFAATPKWLFVDANLSTRNLGRGHADRETLLRELRRDFGQEIVWLGEQPGELPRHHIMMYMVPLDDRTIAVGDEAEALARVSAGDREALDVDPDTGAQTARFERAVALLSQRGFHIVRLPALVLRGERSYVTYTNALFDRARDGTKIVYLPTYDLPALDDEAARRYQALGYQVRRIDVSPIYRLNGSLGCLVNVIARDFNS